LLLLAVVLCQELLPVDGLIPGISVNKAESSSSAALVVAHAARRSSFAFSAKLSWRKATEEDAGTGSFHKCGHSQFRKLDFGPFLSAGRGGEGEEEADFVSARAGGWRGNLAAYVSCSLMVWSRPSIYAVGRRLAAPRMWCLLNLQVRPSLGEPSTALLISSLPSGSFPGDGGDGRRAGSSSKRGGEDRGSDCVLPFTSEVFYAKFQDWVVISQFFKVLPVICTATVWF
jgi:hypothetical protein